MNNIPQVKTEEQARAVCKELGWTIVEKKMYQIQVINTDGEHEFWTGDYETLVDLFDNEIFLKPDFCNIMSLTQQAQIRAICGAKEK